MQGLFSALLSKDFSEEDEESVDGVQTGKDALNAVSFVPVRVMRDFDAKGRHHPLFAHHFFGDDESIAVEDAEIKICFCPQTFHTFIALDSDLATDAELSTIGKQINSVPFPGGFCSSEAELFKRRDLSLCLLGDPSNFGTYLGNLETPISVSVHQPTFLGLEPDNETLTVAQKEVVALHRRMEWFLHWMIDGVSDVDTEDARLQVYLLSTPSGNERKGVDMVGLCTCFRFETPFAIRLRVAQLWIQPQFERKGLGSSFIKFLNKKFVESMSDIDANDKRIIEFTSESPCDGFLLARDVATLDLALEVYSNKLGIEKEKLAGLYNPGNWSELADKFDLWIKADSSLKDSSAMMQFDAKKMMNTMRKLEAEDDDDDEAPRKRPKLDNLGALKITADDSCLAKQNKKTKCIYFDLDFNDKEINNSSHKMTDSITKLNFSSANQPFPNHVTSIPIDRLNPSNLSPTPSLTLQIPSTSQIALDLRIPPFQAVRVRELLLFATLMPTSLTSPPTPPPGSGSSISIALGSLPQLSKSVADVHFVSDPLKTVREGLKLSFWNEDTELREEIGSDEARLVLEKRYLEKWMNRAAIVMKVRRSLLK